MEKNILLYYGFEDGECGIYHAFEAADPEATADDEAVADRLADMLDCEVGDDRFDFKSMLIRLPDSLVERIKEEAVKEYLESQKKAGEAAVYTHDEAARIVELFEEVLDEHDITIPSPEDDEREEDNTARIYGSTYGDLHDEVEGMLIDIANRSKAGADIIAWEYSGEV